MKRNLFNVVGVAVILILCFSFYGENFSKNKTVANKKSFAIVSKGFAVVELYTSEGCSSCPSADKLLKEIRDSYKDQKVYVMSYHVDYWNRLGWRDPFSDNRFSERQSAYADNFKTNQVYTPQAIVNGKVEMIGSASGQLKNAIVKYLSKGEEIDFKASLKDVNAEQINLAFTLPNEAKNQDLVINLIQKDVSTNVKNGENGGRVLPHANVVRYHQVININSNQMEASLKLPSEFKKEYYSVISFVQAKNQGEILGVMETGF